MFLDFLKAVEKIFGFQVISWWKWTYACSPLGLKIVSTKFHASRLPANCYRNITRGIYECTVRQIEAIMRFAFWLVDSQEWGDLTRKNKSACWWRQVLAYYQWGAGGDGQDKEKESEVDDKEWRNNYSYIDISMFLRCSGCADHGWTKSKPSQQTVVDIDGILRCFRVVLPCSILILDNRKNPGFHNQKKKKNRASTFSNPVLW